MNDDKDKLRELMNGIIKVIYYTEVPEDGVICYSMEGCGMLKMIVEKDNKLYEVKIVSWDYEGYNSGLDIFIDKIMGE